MLYIRGEQGVYYIPNANVRALILKFDIFDRRPHAVKQCPCRTRTGTFKGQILSLLCLTFYQGGDLLKRKLATQN